MKKFLLLPLIISPLSYGMLTNSKLIYQSPKLLLPALNQSHFNNFCIIRTDHNPPSLRETTENIKNALWNIKNEKNFRRFFSVTMASCFVTSCFFLSQQGFIESLGFIMGTGLAMSSRCDAAKKVRINTEQLFAHLPYYQQFFADRFHQQAAEKIDLTPWEYTKLLKKYQQYINPTGLRRILYGNGKALNLSNSIITDNNNINAHNHGNLAKGFAFGAGLGLGYRAAEQIMPYTTTDQPKHDFVHDYTHNIQESPVYHERKDEVSSSSWWSSAFSNNGNDSSSCDSSDSDD